MYKKILVPTDLTLKSVNALRVACNIAEKTNAEIDLVHIVQAAMSVRINEDGEYESTAPKGKQFLEDILEYNLAQLEKIKSGIKPNSVSINLRLKVDGFPEKVAELITDEKYDLMVIGGNTRYRFDEFLQATIPEKITKLAKCPVLTINEYVEDFNFRKMILPVNFKYDWSGYIEQLRSMESFFKGEIHMVYVNTPGQFKSTVEIESMLSDFANKHGIDTSNFIIFDDHVINKGIINACDYLDGDLILGISFRQAKIKSLIKGEITESLVNFSKKPVLTFNHNLWKDS